MTNKINKEMIINTDILSWGCEFSDISRQEACTKFGEKTVKIKKWRRLSDI
jgi:hypothetical protein